MPLPDITSLVQTDTFETLFTKNNTIIDRLNLLDISTVYAGTGVTFTGPNTVGGITLSVVFPDISLVTNIGFNVTGSIPSGLTLNSIIGITGGIFGSVSNTSLSSSQKYLGFITAVGDSSYTITTSGFFNRSPALLDNVLYYLSDGGITSTVPTTVGSVIKPVLFSLGNTGAVVLNQKEILISESTSYIKSASRTIAEIPTNGNLIVGNSVFYDIPGATWAKSKADAFNTSEVFGIIESITGLTATVVTQGSVVVPSTVLNDVGSGGGSGGNDIWFLSGTTAGHMQNLAPTLPNQIIKPLYYAYSHAFSGVTFSGQLVNYVGYSTSVTDLSTTLGSIFYGVTGGNLNAAQNSTAQGAANDFHLSYYNFYNKYPLDGHLISHSEDILNVSERSVYAYNSYSDANSFRVWLKNNLYNLNTSDTQIQRIYSNTHPISNGAPPDLGSGQPWVRLHPFITSDFNAFTNAKTLWSNGNFSGTGTPNFLTSTSGDYMAYIFGVGRLNDGSALGTRNYTLTNMISGGEFPDTIPYGTKLYSALNDIETALDPDTYFGVSLGSTTYSTKTDPIDILVLGNPIVKDDLSLKGYPTATTGMHREFYYTLQGVLIKATLNGLNGTNHRGRIAYWLPNYGKAPYWFTKLV
jgi:hypothetical protein